MSVDTRHEKSFFFFSFLDLRVLSLTWQGLPRTSLQDIYQTPSGATKGFTQLFFPQPCLTCKHTLMCKVDWDPCKGNSGFLKGHSIGFTQQKKMEQIYNRLCQKKLPRMTTSCVGGLFDKWSLSVVTMVTDMLYFHWQLPNKNTLCVNALMDSGSSAWGRQQGEQAVARPGLLVSFFAPWTHLAPNNQGCQGIRFSQHFVYFVATELCPKSKCREAERESVTIIVQKHTKRKNYTSISWQVATSIQVHHHHLLWQCNSKGRRRRNYTRDDVLFFTTLPHAL